MAHPRDVKDKIPHYEGTLGDGNVVITKRLTTTRVVRYFLLGKTLTQAWVFDFRTNGRISWYAKTIWWPDRMSYIGSLTVPEDVIDLQRLYATSKR